jgi:hypothetical protein
MFFVRRHVPLPIPPVARPAFITVPLLLLDVDTPSVTDPFAPVTAPAASQGFLQGT